MKKKTKILLGVVITLIVAIVCYVIAGVIIYNTPKQNTLSAISIYNINSLVDENFERNDEDEEQARKTTITEKEFIEYLEELKVQGKLEKYEVGETSIGIYLVDYGYFLCRFDLPEGYQGVSSNSKTNRSNDTISVSTNEISLSVLSAQPCDDISSDVFDNSANVIANADLGYEFTDNIDLSNVTLEFMKTLSKYRVIIWNGHGGYNEDNGIYSFQIGETWTNENYEKYSEEENAGRVVRYIDGGVGITAKFINDYYEDDSFNNTLIYLGSCHLGEKNSTFVETFIKKGAEAVLAYENTVYSGYNQKMCETIFNELVKQDGDTGSTKTVAEALETAKKQNGEKDPTHTAWYDFILSPIFQDYVTKANRAELILTENDDNSFRLVDNASNGNTTEENEKSVVEPTEADFQMFEDMLNKTCWVWQINDSLDTSEISVSELIENFIILDAVPYGMYTNFWDLPDNYYEQTDSKGIFSSGAYKLNADNVDWLITNVFGLTPDRNVSSSEFYYDGKYLYRALELGGGIENIYEITDTKELENGQYGFTVFTHENIEEWSKESEKTLYFSATLKNDDTVGHYWAIDKFSDNASIIGKNTTTDNTKEQSNNSLLEIYQPILDDYYSKCKNEHSIYSYHSFCKYTLYDIDGNGVKELIVQSGTSEGDRTQYVYTCVDNEAALLGEYNAWHLALYGSDKKIIGVDGMGGNWTTYNIVINNNKIVKKEIETVESADSPTYSNKLSFYELFDYSIFIN